MPTRLLTVSCLMAALLLAAVANLVLQPAQSDEPFRSESVRPAEFVAAAKQSAGNPEKSDRQLFMRSKLAMVQRVVEGITTEEYEMVEKGGMELAALAESAAWKSARDPFYGYYSANFEQAIKGLLAAAKSESSEKTTFAYMHVMISCTACHQHVRGMVRSAR